MIPVGTIPAQNSRVPPGGYLVLMQQHSNLPSLNTRAPLTDEPDTRIRKLANNIMSYGKGGGPPPPLLPLYFFVILWGFAPKHPVERIFWYIHLMLSNFRPGQALY